MKQIFPLLALSLLLATPSAHGAEPLSAKVEASHVVEFEFTTMVKRTDPFSEVVLDAIFTEPGGKERRVPAFWAGGRKWKVRYASPVVGKHTFRSECSDANDSGLHGVTGSVEVEPYTGDHPLYKHGPLRVAEGGRYFEFADGTPFFWLGDTWWMGLTQRLSFPDDFNTLLADRKTKGFNVVQIVAGLYPDMAAFDERGANEAGFPWEAEYKAIRPEYFDEADKRINRLVEQGMMPCIVSTWGFHLPWLGVEKMKQHERYVYARWGALPMVWCAAGELTLPYYMEPDFPAGGPKQTAEWEKMIGYCQSINAFDRLISGHPSLPHPMSTRNNFKDPTVLDFDMLQTPHGQMEALAPTVQTVRHSYAAEPVMPVVNAEPSYEMLLDRTPAEIARLMFWASWESGARGYTYGANGIWQVNGRDKPYGKSPHGGDYGHIPWQDAMNLAGSTQVSLGKKLLEQYPWQKFEPRTEWAAWAGDSAIKDVRLGEWIWFPEGNPAADAPAEARFFRHAFDLPVGAKVDDAVLRVAADDRCDVWLNGEKLGASENWPSLHDFTNVADKLKPGRNVLAVRAENLKSNVEKNPAGLTAGLVALLEAGQRVEVVTDAEWRVSRTEAAGWHGADFDDAGWSAAKPLGAFGAPPWGVIGAGGQDPYVVPYAMGIPRQVRIIYMPKPGEVVVNQLEADVHYKAFHFDPVTGDRHHLGDVQPDPAGTWRCPTPAGAVHDWVLILESHK